MKLLLFEIGCFCRFLPTCEFCETRLFNAKLFHFAWQHAGKRLDASQLT